MAEAVSRNPDPLPGKPVARWNLFQPRVVREGNNWREYGVKTPEGQFFHFVNGESTTFIREGSERKPFIKLANNNIVSFDAWKATRKESIRAAFEKAGPTFGELYMHVLTDFPELEQLEVKTGTKEQYPVLTYTGGFWERPKAAGASGAIVVEMTSGEKHYEQLLIDRELSARDAATLLDVDFSVLQQHPQILGMFIMLHEIGHAHDYLVNYQSSANTVIGNDPIHTNEEQRIKEMASLPVPAANPVRVREMWNKGELSTYYNTYQEYYKQQGIYSAADLLKKQEDAYRKLSSESYADKFAALVLRKHWKALGLDSQKAA